jgi:hypothetical protein
MMSKQRDIPFIQAMNGCQFDQSQRSSAAQDDTADWSA